MFTNWQIRDGRYIGNPEEELEKFLEENYGDVSKLKQTFYDILKLADKENLKKELYAVCAKFEDVEANVNGHLEVFETLLNYDLTGKKDDYGDGDYILTVIFFIDLDNEEESRDVTGWKLNNTSDENFYSFTLSLWADWLLCYVLDENINEVGLEKFIAVCLYEMTFWGYTEEQIQAQHAKTIEAMAELEAGKGKRFSSIEELMADLNDYNEN